MEFEFDKEMDSLLRQSAKSDILFPKQNAPTEHIDADEISMFAENALPEKAKPLVIKHLADCDRCRTILSNVIALNSEAVAVAVPATNTKAETVVASTEPSWFQKLFSTRNLAFGMGALALVFAVGIGFVFVQNSMNTQSEMAKVSDTNASSADKAAPNEAIEPTNDEITSANSNTASDLNLVGGQPNADLDGIDSKDSNSILAPSPEKKESSKGNAKNKQSSPINEGLKRSNGTRSDNGQLPPPPPVVSDMITQSDDFEIKEEDRDEKKDAATMARERDDSPAKPSPKRTPRPTSPITTRGGEEKSRRKLGEAESSKGVTTSKAKRVIPSRRINGKTFTRKNNTWTDSAYKNQRTTTVKRETTQYRKLDTGLQSIGNQLDGTVVVVWKSKAYKIQ